MTDGFEDQEPKQRRPLRQPDSIWERYLTGKLSLTDKETLPALIKELHREIAEHLGQRSETTKRYASQPQVDPLTPADPIVEQTTKRKPTSGINVKALSAHLAKRRPIDPRRN